MIKRTLATLVVLGALAACNPGASPSVSSPATTIAPSIEAPSSSTDTGIESPSGSDDSGGLESPSVSDGLESASPS